MLTYGSCKLEAADSEADMDLICVAPNVSIFRSVVDPNRFYLDPDPSHFHAVTL